MFVGAFRIWCHLIAKIHDLKKSKATPKISRHCPISIQDVPSRHWRGTGDIILDYMVFSVPLPHPARSQRPSNPNSSMSRKAEEERETDRKIKLTVFIMWLCFHPRTFIQKVTFERKFFFLFRLHPFLRPSHDKGTVQRLSHWFSARP